MIGPEMLCQWPGTIIHFTLYERSNLLPNREYPGEAPTLRGFNRCGGNMQRVFLCFIWGLSLLGGGFRDACPYEVTLPDSEALQEYLEEQGFDDPVLPFILAQTTRDKDLGMVINRYRVEQDWIDHSRHSINQSLLPSITVRPEPSPTVREQQPIIISADDPSGFNMNVLHWHLSTDNPEQFIEIHKQINLLLLGLFSHSLFKEVMPDIVVISGVQILQILQSYAQIDSFCQILLREFYTTEYINEECRAEKEPGGIYAVNTQHMLQQSNVLVISRYPLRGVESAATAPYRVCRFYGRWGQHLDYGFALFFQVYLDKHWLKFAAIASYDYFNLDYPHYNWEKNWKSCLADKIKPDLESWLAEDEVAVVITRIFNIALNSLSQRLKDWMRLTHKEHTGVTVDFNPEQNTKAADLSWFYRYTLRKTQLTHLSLFKNSPKRRMKSFGVPLRVLVVDDDEDEQPADESSQSLLSRLLSVFYTVSPEKNDFVAFYPTVAEVVVPYRLVPESSRYIPLSKDFREY